jgi:hypothetical protein
MPVAGAPGDLGLGAQQVVSRDRQVAVDVQLLGTYPSRTPDAQRTVPW